MEWKGTKGMLIAMHRTKKVLITFQAEDVNCANSHLTDK